MRLARLIPALLFAVATLLPVTARGDDPRPGAVPALVAEPEAPPAAAQPAATHPAAPDVAAAQQAIATAQRHLAAPKVDPVALGTALLAAQQALAVALNSSGIPTSWWDRHPDFKLGTQITLALLGVAGAGLLTYAKFRSSASEP